MAKSVIPRASKKEIEKELEVSKQMMEDEHYMVGEILDRKSVADDYFSRIHDHFQKDEC